MGNQSDQLVICDGELEIVRITEDLYDETVKLYQDHFMRYENVSIACNLRGTQQSIDEMEILIRAILIDGISFAARHRKTKTLVAICVNKMLCPASDCSLSAVCDGFRSPGMICVGKYLERMETTFDLFKEWNIDCVMEIVFLSTHKDFTGRGLATILSKYSIDFARQMLNGTLPERELLPESIRELKPKAVCSVFTSQYSQKIGERLGMETVVRIPYTEFSFEGKTFAEKLDPVHKYSTYAAMRL